MNNILFQNFFVSQSCFEENVIRIYYVVLVSLGWNELVKKELYSRNDIRRTENLSFIDVASVC